jgi:DNA-binding NarL/FixJ family response regulator
MMVKKQSGGGKTKCQVLLVDDHPVVRSGLSQLINLQKDLEVCGEAEDTAGALKAVAHLHPKVVIVDLFLGQDMEGLELIKDIKTRFPHIAILVLSMHDEMIFAERALRAGAQGYLMKNSAMKTVISAIRQVAQGEIYLSDKMSKRILSGTVGHRQEQSKLSIERLTDRELEVLHLIGRGMGSRVIGEYLHLSVKTIEAHQTHIRKKLNLTDAAALRQFAIQWVKSVNLA